jgi:hypothetical protein
MFSGIGFAFVLGLVIGWNVLPQPEWIKTAYDWVVAKIKEWLPQ